MKKFLALASVLIAGFFGTSALAQGTSCGCPPLASRTEVTITDPGTGTGTTTWTCDNIYKLDGYVFDNNGQTLTIEPGTVIKGLPGSGSDASALIVARGGAINAAGTADCPIIMTFDADPLDGSVAYDTRGQWGGFIVLGAAPTNLATNEGQVEGIPSDNDRAKYGGNNAEDNSGTIQYVSVRHGGTQLAAANEINGITLAGVGNGTTIDHVEVISNLDDGIEFFGGTVDVKYAAVAFCGDDSFDYDQGYDGRGQYWFVLQDQPGNVGDRGGEYDGDDASSGNVTPDFQPYATPEIYNYTSIGSGPANNKQGLLFRNGGGGDTRNAIIANFAEGIEIEDLDTFDAYDNFLAGRLNLSQICMVNVNEVIDYDGSAVPTGDADLDAYAAANGVAAGTPGIDFTYNLNGAGTSFTDTFDPVPSNDVTVGAGNLATDPYFDAADYKGAFDPNGTNWLAGWSWFSDYSAIAFSTGCTDPTACNFDPTADEDDGSCTFPAPGFDCNGDPIGGGTCNCPPLASRTEVIVTDGGSGTGTTTWTCDNVYKLDGYVFVNSGQTLTIEPGTVVKGLPGSGSDASALIVARGGAINAAGTADCPITFTFDADPLDGSVAYDTRGQWGGLIVLGAASTNLATNEGQVEGIPSDNDRAKYGGTNDGDNSGTLQYISIRHGGTQLAAANEINGLTLAGVGNGTTIDHVEVISNLDDGIEFFGGTVDVKYAAVGFCGDDSFDYDQGYRGRGQYWFVLQDQPGNVGDRGGEYDGDDASDGNVTPDFQPYATPTIYNYTSIGSGPANNKQGLLFRNGAGGDTRNAIIANFAEGIEIEDLDTFDAYDNFLAGRLNLSQICMVNVNEVIDYDGSAVPTGDADLDAYAAANGIASGTPGIDFTYNFDGAGITVTDELSVNPSNDVTVGTGNLPTDPYFDAADYKGAFDPNGGNWMSGWSYMDQVGLFGDTSVIDGCTDVNACNYNPAATNDDGSCILPGDSCDDGDANTINDTVQADCSCAGEVPGCTDPTACNFDPNADTDDGSCEFLSCAGCTDSGACNFDPTATIDDGSCEFLSCAGCTDPTACNFDNTATIEDNSCEFPGDSCDDGNPNTVLDELQPDCSCAGLIPGCTDSDATNFDPAAETEDGSCTYVVEFFVDMAVEGSNAAFITGDQTGGTPVAMTYIGYDVYRFSVALGAGTYNYNFQNATNTDESISRQATVVDAPVVLDVVCFNEIGACAGCTNPMFVEYNPYAGSDDGSCGNMIVPGCTYVDADNYDAAANYDDGSCTFTIGGPNDCPEDLDSNGLVNAADLLQFLSAFGSACE